MGLFSFTQEIAIDLGTANTIIRKQAYLHSCFIIPTIDFFPYFTQNYHIYIKSVTAFSAVTLALPQGLEPWTP